MPESRPPEGERPEDETPADEREPAEGDREERESDEESSEQQTSSGNKDVSDADEQQLTAPSVGPHTTFEKEPPEERLARHDQSDTDAMGLDKRREVAGGSYGPSLGRQAFLYGIFLAVVIALVIGLKFLVDEFDQPPKTDADAAPWVDNEIQPGRIDFPRYGRPASNESPGPEL